MRAIAEEAFELVRAYKGSHSGEHGDGIVRSEFHERMFGERLVRAFEQVKEWFDPKGLYNPGKIVHAPKFDDRRVSRYGPDYRGENIRTQLDWSAYPGAGGGFQGAVEMCNNNGACRALTGGVMCPSYRVTRDERDLTRGRANTLRLAITGQLEGDALSSDEMAETMKLCVSCKACRRECPTGVDMARMKVEVQAARVAKRGLSLHDRLIGYLPRYAPLAAKWPTLANLRNDAPRLRQWSERYAGLSARRSLPRWRADAWREPTRLPSATETRSVVFFADTFNRYFEPENIEAALAVLAAGGYTVHLPQPTDGGRRPPRFRRPLPARGGHRRGAARGGALRDRARPLPRARNSVRRPRAELRARLPRRNPVAGQARRCAPLGRERAAVRGVPGARGEGRRAQAPARAGGQAGAAARPLPPEILRCHGRGRGRAQARAGFGGRNRGLELLRHGGRLRLRRRHHRRLAQDGGAFAPSRRAQSRGRHAHPRRRHLMPASDQGRQRARGPPRRARVGDER